MKLIVVNGTRQSKSTPGYIIIRRILFTWFITVLGVRVLDKNTSVISIVSAFTIVVGRFQRRNKNARAVYSPSVVVKISPDPSRLLLQHLDSNGVPDSATSRTNTFDRIKSIDKRLEKLERCAPDMLSGFYDPHLKSFSVRPGTSRFSVTSTLFSIAALQSSQNEELFSSIVNMDMQAATIQTSPESRDNVVDQKILVQDVVRAVMLTEEVNKEDLFQVPLLVHVLLNIDKNRVLFQRSHQDNVEIGKITARMKSLVTTILSTRPLITMSDYLIFLCAQALASLNDSTNGYTFISDQSGKVDDTHEESPDDANQLDEEISKNQKKDLYGSFPIGNLPQDALPTNSSSQLSTSLLQYTEVGFNELCKQLAYVSAEDRTNFDAIRLAYSLLTYVITTNSISGSAIQPVTSNQGSPVNVIKAPNTRLIKKALNVFFKEQNQDGLWSKGQPIYKSFRKTGRNVGNAFVFPTDTLGSLMNTLPADLFRPHMGALERTLTWIEDHETLEVISNFCDPITLKCYGKPLRGWSSPHLQPDDGPQAWSTAQTITCILSMRKVVRELLNDDVLAEFGGIKNCNGPKPEAWNRLLDTDLGYPCESIKCRTLKDVLEERFIEPFSDQSSIAPSFSAILFGPPGTAKTTICEALAEVMGWDFLVIDTSVFLADGLSNIAARIRYVFERLMELEKCVILFDEIEEFCLDRETPGLAMESRMLTTAMLTAINDLRRRKRSIFFLATNRLRAFDSAIIRPGRFDMQLFVGTPNREARVIQFEQKLANIPVDDVKKAQALVVYREFLDSIWEGDGKYFNYLEGLKFASSCADIVAAGSELTLSSMAPILDAQAAVMTVRGQVRDEYIASMELTRL